MRLRNLFMILLLCMTVGVFSVACTGDDGAQGPPGPAGPAGPAGPGADDGDGDGEMPEVSETYSFLKSWGVDEGVSCSSDILSTTADLPGPDLIDIKERANDGIDAPVTATCSNTLFGMADPMQGGMTLDPAPGANQIYFYKASRSGESIVEKMSTEKTAYSLDILTTITKDLVGGKVYAKLATTGGDEAIERQLLHSQCTEGTDPPDIVGDFRAVRIVSAAQEYINSVPCTTGNEGTCTPATNTTVKYKVCVRLDAHPGQVKCLVVDHGAVTIAAGGAITNVSDADNEKTFIGLYDGMDVNDLEVPGVDFETTEDGDVTSAGNFFADTTTEPANVYNHICHLFGLE